jgi:hypothetical protein
MHDTLIEYADLISLLTAVGTFVAIVAGVVELIKVRRDHVKEKEQEFNSSYLTISDAYHRLLELSVEYPHLGIFPWQEEPADLSPDDLVRRDIFYEMMISIFERAYLERHKTPEISEHFWPGWETFLRRQIEKPSFRKYWGIFEGEGAFGAYDRRFEAFAKGLDGGQRTGGRAGA